MNNEDIRVRDILNAQTGQLDWSELVRHFARGVVVCVAPGEDLVTVAESMVGDNQAAINQLNEQGRLRRAQDDDARRWTEENSRFWAVVVAPWVLVQEISDEAPSPHDRSD